ncbi:Sphingomyelin phosphodiesterase [Leucoagaricus sp. SymC.cos]|nr:Sphingomyelin phosphodiesterase [Leucoagaricus sp. SymC.cos]
MRFWRPLPLLLAFYTSNHVHASLVDDIVTALTQAVDCDSCHALLIPLKGLAALGNSAFSDTMAAVCKAIGAEDDDVCDGALGEQGPILAHDLRAISPFGRTSTQLCNSVFGLCQQPTVNQMDFPLPVTPANPKQWTSKGRQPFQVAHFSDSHIDRDYTPGSEVQCTKPICCRNYADEAGQAIKQPAGALASHNCDTSTGLAESMLRAVSMQKISFSIFTGDVIEGDIWLVNQTGVTAHLQQFDQEMQTLTSTPVFPVIGNHDTAPVNSFPRNTTANASSQWVFDTQATGWSEWLSASATDSVQHMSGSYAAVPSGMNLRIISLNTLYWYKANFWLFDSDTFQPDPNGILAFVAQQLQAAEDAGQRAWILGHMPPSSSDALHDQSNYFDQIVQRYKNTIAQQFYGHTHKDEFAISYSDYDNRTAENAVSTMLMGPSLTPSTGNPSFKVYDVDPDTYEIMDARVFRGDLADPSFQTSPQWNQYYSAREVYGSALPGGWPASAPLSPSFWHQVTEAFEGNDTLFQQFLAFKWRGVNIESCRPQTCKDDAICALRGGRSEDNCVVTSPGLPFRKRDSGKTNVVGLDDCEGTSLRVVFSQLSSKMPDVDIADLKEKLEQKIPQ